MAESDIAVQQCRFLEIPLGMKRQASTWTSFECRNVRFHHCSRHKESSVSKALLHLKALRCEHLSWEFLSNSSVYFFLNWKVSNVQIVFPVAISRRLLFLSIDLRPADNIL
jgi:hypothetical protein